MIPRAPANPTSPTAAPPGDSVRTSTGPGALVITAGIALLGVVFASGLALGWQLRSDRPAKVHVGTGRAYAGDDQIGLSADGWSYAVPLDVPWRTAAGEWTTGSRPACLPPLAAVQNLRFGWLQFTTHGTTDRRVVWVECP